MIARLGGVCLLVVAIALTPGPASAQCPVDPAVGSEVAAGTADPAARLRFIRAQMEVGARRSRIWAASWGTTYGAAVITQLAVSPLVDRDTRIDLYVGATSAFIGTLTRSISIPRVIRERRRLARRMAADDDPCATLRFAEQALARSAKSEAFGRSLLLRTSAIVYNVGVGFVLGLALHHPLSGIRQATIGATVGQIMVVTQPTTMIQALEGYRDGELSPAPLPYLQPLVLHRGGGLSVAGRF